MLNIDDPKEVESTPAIFRLGFRPFFLGAAMLAALYIPLWLTAWLLPTYSPFSDTFWANVVPLWWHPHEMLFGFALAVASGFLLSAVQTWTNQPSLKGWPLALTFGAWLAARISLLLPINIPLLVPAIFDTLFLLSVAFTLWRCISTVKQWRNIGFPIMFLVATGVNLVSYYALAQRDFVLANQLWQAMLWWLALLITIVGGRVIPFFTAIRIKTPKPEPLTWLEYPLLVLMMLLVIEAVFHLVPTHIEQILLLIAGTLHLVRWSRWQPLKSRHEPMLWSLQLAYLCLPVAIIGLGFYVDNQYAYRSLLHLLAIGCMAGLCLAMMSRVSLGHTSRNIYQGPKMTFAFIAIFCAAILRAVMPLIMPQYTTLWLWLACAAWSTAFGLFAWHYAPILSRPRIDGRPG